MPNKCAKCIAGHVFCFDCIVRGAESVLADGKTEVKCFTECDSEISLATLQISLSPTTFSVLLKKRQAAEVEAAGIEGLVSCPFCTFASIPPAEDKVFKCLNPECMKESCRYAHFFRVFFLYKKILIKRICYTYFKNWAINSTQLYQNIKIGTH